MSGAFTPDKGTLFYVDCTRKQLKESSEGGMPTLVWVQIDRSYSGIIFECVATDDHVVVAKMVCNGWSHTAADKLHTILRSDFKFVPVGPDVAKALGVAKENEQ